MLRYYLYDDKKNAQSMHSGLHPAISTALKSLQMTGRTVLTVNFTHQQRAEISSGGLLLYIIETPELESGKKKPTKAFSFSGRPNESGWFLCSGRADGLDITLFDMFIAENLPRDGAFVVYGDRAAEPIEVQNLPALDAIRAPTLRTFPLEILPHTVIEWCKANAPDGSLQLRKGSAVPENAHLMLVGVRKDGKVHYITKGLVDAYALTRYKPQPQRSPLVWNIPEQKKP